jgi:hypothetical protein
MRGVTRKRRRRGFSLRAKSAFSGLVQVSHGQKTYSLMTALGDGGGAASERLLCGSDGWVYVDEVVDCLASRKSRWLQVWSVVSLMGAASRAEGEEVAG